MEKKSGFNPSQVGYKLINSEGQIKLLELFQSLTGRLQTTEEVVFLNTCSPFQSLTGRLQTNPSSGRATTPTRQRHSL